MGKRESCGRLVAATTALGCFACGAAGSAGHETSSGSHAASAVSGASAKSTGATSASGTGDPAAGSGASSTSGTSAAPPGVDAGAPPPVPTTVSLKNIGRHGETLFLQIQGSDPAEQTTEAHVQLLDSAGAPVVAFDTNWDGVLDSDATLLHFDQSALGQKTFTSTITLPNLFAGAPSIASAVVALSNVWQELSPSVAAMLEPQAIAAMNGSCDPNEISNRCADGLSCTGTTPTCQPASPPSFTHVAYYGGAVPTEVFEGANPAGALSSIDVAFLDANGNPVDVDLGDGTLVTSVSLPANGVTDPTFSLVNDPAQTFTAAVSKISATPTDSLGRMGAAVTADLAMQPLAATARACDPTGLIGCYAADACSPGLVGANNVCAGVPTLQAAKCALASATTAVGVLAAWGVAQGVSLWDPPSGCILPTEVGHPEALVTLKLATAVTTLVVSTAVPETNFDTVLYILPPCASSSSQALGCNDDAPGGGYASTLTLTNVAAGTYTVVVDSAAPAAGQFGLTVVTH
jgi:hypothetical protein